MIRFPRFFGFPLTVHVSALFVLALVVLPAASSGPQGLLDGLIRGLIVFGSILVHEFGHATVADLKKLGPVEIVLHGFGGLTVSKAVRTPGDGILLTAAGPAAGFLLGGIGVALAVFFRDTPIGAHLVFLAVVNLFWSAFNLLPMFPLDGGHLLLHTLALKWPPRVAARWAARVGIGVAIPVAAVGLWAGQIFIPIVAALSVWRSWGLATDR